MSNVLLTEEQWEALWFINTIINYKSSLDDSHKMKELDELRETQLSMIADINKKLDHIIERLDKIEKI